VNLSQWKAAVRERAGGKCERCGRPEEPRPDGRDTKHHAHHIDRDPSNNTLENGEYLCARCHADEHDRPGLVALDDAMRHQADETKEKIKAARAKQVNPPKSEAARRRIGEAHKGRTVSPEQRARISRTMRERGVGGNPGTRSEATKAKMRAASARRWSRPEEHETASTLAIQREARKSASDAESTISQDPLAPSSR
jgi:hypothetical protein